MKWVILAIFVGSTLYVHFRGRVRLKFFRQLTDHSMFMAPINVLMYACSRVPTRPYVSTEFFDELKPLTASWQDIRTEALALRDAQQIKASSSYNDVGFNSFFRRGWKRFYLKWYDDAHPSARELCPKTTEILNTIPSVKAAMFAELPPGSELRKHRDPYAGSIRYHLGLITPGDDRCYIEVDGERYSWRDGEAVMFDETYIHRAENGTDHDRIILFCDVERPMRWRWAAALNRFIAKHLVAAGASPNQDGDKVGGLNRVFASFYAVRLKAKALREKSKPLYYILKFAIFGGILAWIFWP
ncbi:MAG TPA: lipid A hydroxylase LpxO [Tahibacter sp.]|nr:lipid A hydroxylase LpxO [Tahibacter sp.]